MARSKKRLSSVGDVALAANDDSRERAKGKERRTSRTRRSFGRAGETAMQQVSRQSVSKEYTDDLFAHCMQLLTKNKINQKNTWDLDLIDHAEDVLELEKTSGKETDFQKASCTLDASVKIYGYRVESVHKQTYRVWGDLSSGFKAKNGAGDEDDSDQEDDDQPSSSARARARRKAARGVKTLETNVNNINAKDADFLNVTDDTFRRTAAAFDEGGARGLLLNNIGIRNGCQLAFDDGEEGDVIVQLEKISEAIAERARKDQEAAETEAKTQDTAASSEKAEHQEEEEQEALVEMDHDGEKTQEEEEKEKNTQVTEMKEEEKSMVKEENETKENNEETEMVKEEDDEDFCLSIAPLLEKLGDFNLQKLEVCPAFSRFQFGPDGNGLACLQPIDKTDDDLLLDQVENMAPTEDMWQGVELQDDDQPMIKEVEDEEEEDDDDEGIEGGDQFDLVCNDVDDDIDELLLDEFVPSQPSPASMLGEKQREISHLIPDTTGVELAVMLSGEDDHDDYSYFAMDKMVMLQKNWAGPSHWKFTKATRNKPLHDVQESESESSASSHIANPVTKVRKKRNPFYIDFNAPPIQADIAFCKSRASTVLSSTQLKRAANKELLLPEDQHYEVKNLIRLFTKPKWRLRRCRRSRMHAENAESAVSRFEYVGPSEEQPECLEAPAVPENVDEIEFDMAADHSFTEDQDNHPSDEPFDYPPTLSNSNATETLLAGMHLVDEPDKVNDLQINYARKAKQVDVKALKSSIWTELCDEEEDENDENQNHENDGIRPEKRVKVPEKMASSGKKFQDMLQKIPDRVAPSQREQISVPFCFICLLHLCNEKNLELVHEYGNLTELGIREGYDVPPDATKSI